MKYAPMTDVAKPKPPADAFKKLSAATVKGWMDAAFFADVKAKFEEIPYQTIGDNVKMIYLKAVTGNPATYLKRSYNVYEDALPAAFQKFAQTIAPAATVKAEVFLIFIICFVGHFTRSIY